MQEPTPPLPHVPAQRRALDVPVLVQRTRQLLAAGVPLTLLLDLGEEGGPRSTEWYRREAGPQAG